MEMSTQAKPAIMASLPPPPARPDQRRAADAAALNRAPRPDIPLPIPPSNGQIGAISQTLIASRTEERERADNLIPGISSVERTLKPYGITMLPQPPGENDPGSYS